MCSRRPGRARRAGRAARAAARSESGSPKRMWMSPKRGAGGAPRPTNQPKLSRLLRAAALLGDVVADVLDLVVGDRDRDQEDVLALAAPVGVDHVGEQPEARRQQLARARAPALDVPLEREALLDQVVDVLLQHELVDRVVLERAADEEDAAAPHQRPDREEVHVDAAGGVVRRVAVLVQRVLQHQVVEVRLVRRQEDDRMALRRARRSRSSCAAVVVQRLAVAARVEQVDQLRGEVDDVRAVGRGDLAQVARGLAPRPSPPACRARAPAARCRRERPAARGCPRGRSAAPCSARRAARRSARSSASAAWRATKSARPVVCADVGAAGLPPALAQLRDRRGLARHDAAALGMAAQHPRLAQAPGIARVAEREQLATAGRARAAVSPAGQPRDAQRRQQRIVVGGEARLRAAGRACAAPPRRDGGIGIASSRRWPLPGR